MLPLFYICFATVASAAKLSNVWTSLSISSPQGNRPQDIHSASLGWRIATGDASSGDTFDIIMPGVFRTKFGEQQLKLVVDDTTYALCDAWDGSYITDYSSLSCTVTSAVNTDRDITATGVATFDFVFGAGGSSRSSDLYQASLYHAGKNTINWSGLSTTVDFVGGPFFNENDNDGLIYYSRSTPQFNEQLYVLSASCPDGITSGYTIITFEKIYDCSQFSIKMTKDLNDFYLPEGYEDVPESQVICQSGRIAARFADVPAGYRVFLQGLYRYPLTSDTVYHDFGGNVQCSSGQTKTNNYGREIVVITGDSESSGNSKEIIVTTTTWTETYTTVTTLPYESTASTITVVVEVPDTDRTTTTTTYTSPWTGSFTTTKTLPYETEGPTVTVTVEVDVPTSESSSESSSSSSSSNSVSISDSSSASVSSSASISSVASSFSSSESVSSASSSASGSRSAPELTTTTTTTTTWSNPYTSTTTLPITSGATEVTVIVEVPTGGWSNSSVSSTLSSSLTSDKSVECETCTVTSHDTESTTATVSCDECHKSSSVAETSQTQETETQGTKKTQEASETQKTPETQPAEETQTTTETEPCDECEATTATSLLEPTETLVPPLTTTAPQTTVPEQPGTKGPEEPEETEEPEEPEKPEEPESEAPEVTTLPNGPVEPAVTTTIEPEEPEVTTPIEPEVISSPEIIDEPETTGVPGLVTIPEESSEESESPEIETAPGPEESETETAEPQETESPQFFVSEFTFEYVTDDFAATEKESPATETPVEAPTTNSVAAESVVSVYSGAASKLVPSLLVVLLGLLV